MISTTSSTFYRKPAIPRSKHVAGAVGFVPNRAREISSTVVARLKGTTYGHLARAILRYSLERGLSSGDKLPAVRQLAIIFGVSSPTIRCALTALEATGHLHKMAGIGSFLIDRSISFRFVPCKESSPLLVLQSCVTIEPEIAAEAARKCTPEILLQIRQLENELQVDNENSAVPSSKISSSIRFHELIATAGGPQMVTIIGGLWRSFYAELNQGVFACLSRLEHRREMMLGYKELVDAICTHDQRRAKHAMRRHLISLQEIIRLDPVVEVGEMVAVKSSRRLPVIYRKSAA